MTPSQTSAPTNGLPQPIYSASERPLTATVRDLADQALATPEPDPHVLARRWLSKLTDEQREAVLVKGFTEILMEQMRFARQNATTGQRVGESKMARALRDRRPLSRGWELYENCTVVDLDELIAQYDGIIASTQAKRDELRVMRERLASSGCTTVGELLARDERQAA